MQEKITSSHLRVYSTPFLFLSSFMYVYNAVQKMCQARYLTREKGLKKVQLREMCYEVNQSWVEIKLRWFRGMNHHNLSYGDMPNLLSQLPKLGIFCYLNILERLHCNL